MPKKSTSNAAPVIDPPSQHLGLHPEIVDEENLSLALAWIRFLRPQVKGLQLAYEQRLAELNAEFATIGKMLLDDDEWTTCQDYLQSLETAVERYARKHDKQLCGEGRSWESEHGKIALAKQPEKVTLTRKSDTEAKLVERLLSDLDIQPEIDRLRAEFPDFAEYIRLEFKLNKAGILDGLKQKRLTLADLRSRGLKITRNPDKVTITV